MTAESAATESRPPHGWFSRAAGRWGVAAVSVTLIAAIEAVTYPRWRRWCLGWGATPAEVSRALPGDDLLPRPAMISTRAIGVSAPAAVVWPWLAQMGPGRGGAYTYDWIENLLGLGMHSADRILPEFQDVKVGDAKPLGARGPVLRVAAVEPERSLVLRSDDGNWVWAFSLAEDGPGTRLISRNRISILGAPPAVRALYRYVMEPGSLVMERKMLLGIKDRAERLASEAP
jgi:hypothetical protein